MAEAETDNNNLKPETVDFDDQSEEGETESQDGDVDDVTPDFDETFKFMPRTTRLVPLAEQFIEIQSQPSLLDALVMQKCFKRLDPYSSASKLAKVMQRSDYNVEMWRKKSPTSIHVKVPCIYENCGCRETVSQGSWLAKDHYEQCSFRPLPCILSESDCPEEVPYHAYVIHLQTHLLYPSYTSNLTSKVFILREEFERDVSYSPKWISAWGLHFFLHLVRRTPGTWSSWVSLYDNGSGLNPSSFLARITYYKELRSVGGIYPVQSVRVVHADMEKERACLLTSDATIREVCQIGENLLTDFSVHLEIVKYTGPPQDTSHEHVARESGDQQQQSTPAYSPRQHAPKISVTTSQLDLSTNSASATAPSQVSVSSSTVDAGTTREIQSPTASFSSMHDLKFVQDEHEPEPTTTSSSASVFANDTPSAAANGLSLHAQVSAVDVEFQPSPSSKEAEASQPLHPSNSNSTPIPIRNLSEARLSEEFVAVEAIDSATAAAVESNSMPVAKN